MPDITPEMLERISFDENDAELLQMLEEGAHDRKEHAIYNANSR